MKKTVIEISTEHEVWCFGEILENSNFECVFDDSAYDGVVADIDTEIYNSWEKIVERIRDKVNPDLEEIVSC